MVTEFRHTWHRPIPTCWPGRTFPKATSDFFVGVFCLFARIMTEACRGGSGTVTKSSTYLIVLLYKCNLNCRSSSSLFVSPSQHSYWGKNRCISRQEQRCQWSRPHNYYLHKGGYRRDRSLSPAGDRENGMVSPRTCEFASISQFVCVFLFCSCVSLSTEHVIQILRQHVHSRFTVNILVFYDNVALNWQRQI